MLTTVAVGLMSGEEIVVPLLLLQQLAVGILCGLLLGKLAIWALKRGAFPSGQSQTIFIFSVVILSYAPAHRPGRKRVSQRLPLRHLDGQYQAAPEALSGPLL